MCLQRSHHCREDGARLEVAIPREGHSATLLPNGKVLVVGGGATAATSKIAELFDPAANGGKGAWRTTAPLPQGRFSHTATLLPNGKVLVIGGEWKEKSDVPKRSRVSLDHIYDPAADGGKGAWTVAGSLQVQRFGHTATLLPSGNILVVGGFNEQGKSVTSIELYSPSTKKGRSTSIVIGEFEDLRYPTSATLLPHGNVLIVGNTNYNENSCLHHAHIVTVSTNQQSAMDTVVSDPLDLCAPTVTILQDKSALIVGVAVEEGEDITKALLYDSTKQPDNWIEAWRTTDPPHTVGRLHTATTLPNGTVLFAGGYTDSAEIFVPATTNTTTRWSRTDDMTSLRSRHTATKLLNNTILVVGGADESDNPLASAEIYEPAMSTAAATVTALPKHQGATNQPRATK
ncbi:MAG: kelch motif-containing protein [Nitrospira sp.]|nr:kelch motif-containing protein [Nitrospira sp.]